MLYCQGQNEKDPPLNKGGLEVPCELTFSIPNRTKDKETTISKLENY